ncbi:MAG: DUF4129 domain-containing protein [Myxococcaceae bacterium]|nr:DUF4129 domain-containing protein [Myxococcaceae bacterium]
MAVDALELRPRTTLQLFDGAIRLCSRTMGVWAITLPAGAALVAATFHLAEAMQHKRHLALPALLFTAAWLFRAISQGAAAHHLEQQLLEPGEPSSSRSFVAALKRAPALIYTAGFSLTLNAIIWCFSLGIGFFLVTAHLAAYAVAMKGRGSLLGLYATCSKMLGPARHTASTLRLCGLLQVILFFNLHLLVNASLTVCSKLLAFDITFASRFVSFDNPTWLAALVALTFSLFEPIRAASAALLLIDGRVRQEGLDLLTQLEQLPRRRKPKAPVAAAVVLALALVPGVTFAQDPEPDDWSGTWVPGQPTSGQASSAMSQRLHAVVDDCGLGQRFARRELEAVDQLPPSSAAALTRLVTRVERLAWDDEDCDAAGDELERALKELEHVHAGDADSAEARDAARAVLARPEFAVDPPDEPKSDKKPDDDEEPSWFKKLLERFFKWLFEPDRDRRPSSPPPQVDLGLATGLSNLVMFAAVGLVVGLLLWLLLRGLGNARGARETAADESGVIEAPLAPDPMNALSRPPEGWAGLADELAAKGLFREAIRNLYLALLSRLHRDGAIDYDPSKSNWDYFRGFKGPLTALQPFRELTRRFDFAWYGNLEVSSGSWADFRSITRPLLDAPPAETAHA